MLSCQQNFSCNYLSKRFFKKNTSTFLFYGIRSLPAFFPQDFPSSPYSFRSYSFCLPCWCKVILLVHVERKDETACPAIASLNHTTFEEPLHLFKPICGKIWSECLSFLRTKMNRHSKNWKHSVFYNNSGACTVKHYIEYIDLPRCSWKRTSSFHD